MKHVFILLAVLFASCTSVDVEKSVKTSMTPGSQKAPASPTIIYVPIEADPVIIEKPMYIPEGSAPKPAQGRTAVERSNKEGILQPQDYEKAVIIYDYHRDFVYQVYCQPLRVTDITLQAGERIAEPPFISDSERWIVGAGAHYEADVAIQHIYLKPAAANLHASLIINTNVRTYHLILKSFSDIHMPVIRFRYPAASFPQNFIASPSGKGPPAASGDDNSGFLSFNYKVTYAFLSKPRWLPALVYDDGHKTYITFPETVLQTEMPTVFENRTDIVNYRMNRNVMVIDKLVEKVSIKLGKHTVVIEKKRSGK
jgi:type IV secretion system protein VirB9